jgi:hypothetical protein
MHKRVQLKAIKVTPLGSLPRAKATRLAKKKANGNGRREANIEATQFWHQGFGRIMVKGVPVVPFLTRESAERVAAQATRNTEWPMKVVAVQDFWGYREEEAG